MNRHPLPTPALKGPFKGSVSQPKSPINQFLDTVHERHALRVFYLLLKNLSPALKSSNLPNAVLTPDEAKQLREFHFLLPQRLGELVVTCEALPREYQNAYEILGDTLVRAVDIYIGAEIRLNKDNVHIGRYDRALSIITDLMEPLPHKGIGREIGCHTLTVRNSFHPYSLLERKFGDALTKAATWIFLQMRNDGKNDHVDFIVERATHIPADSRKYTHIARSSIQTAFAGIYFDHMDNEERQTVTASRFYTESPVAKDLIDRLLERGQPYDHTAVRGRQAHAERSAAMPAFTPAK